MKLLYNIYAAIHIPFLDTNDMSGSASPPTFPLTPLF